MPGWISNAPAAVVSTISVVSEGLAIRMPVSTAIPRRAPITLSSRPVTRALTVITPTTAIRIGSRLFQIVSKSMPMPTVIRNTPSARPLNGSMMPSTSEWYSVSAISRPATSAPTIGERPTSAVARLAPITTSSDAARNSSGLLVRAAWANRRGRARRPITIIASTTSAPIQIVSNRPSSPSLAA